MGIKYFFHLQYFPNKNYKIIENYMSFKFKLSFKIQICAQFLLAMSCLIFCVFYATNAAIMFDTKFSNT